jgi:hypothetical protein
MKTEFGFKPVQETVEKTDEDYLDGKKTVMKLLKHNSRAVNADYCRSSLELLPSIPDQFLSGVRDALMDYLARVESKK